ncbi:MAG: hypothetical protein ACREGL_04305, partial [Alphaproteobacteria bacterium]
GVRAASFARGAGYVQARLLARGELGREPLPGPAIIESYDSTIALPPGATARSDDTNCVVIDLAD